MGRTIYGKGNIILNIFNLPEHYILFTCFNCVFRALALFLLLNGNHINDLQLRLHLFLDMSVIILPLAQQLPRCWNYILAVLTIWDQSVG